MNTRRNTGFIRRLHRWKWQVSAGLFVALVVAIATYLLRLSSGQTTIPLVSTTHFGKAIEIKSQATYDDRGTWRDGLFQPKDKFTTAELQLWIENASTYQATNVMYRVRVPQGCWISKLRSDPGVEYRDDRGNYIRVGNSFVSIKTQELLIRNPKMFPLHMTPVFMHIERETNSVPNMPPVEVLVFDDENGILGRITISKRSD